MAQTSIATEITEAIGAHGAWKTRLRAAASTGAAAVDPAQVADHHACRFGTWLDGHLRSNPRDATARHIHDLHQQFHRCAGAVAEDIRVGQATQALKTIESGSYKLASEALVAAMMEWRRVA